MKKLTGISMIKDGIKHDYCFEECIASLKEFCDELIICDAGSIDGTAKVLKKMEDRKTKVIYCEPEEWEEQKYLKHQILNYFSNKAIAEVVTDWVFYQQADEILHEKCYQFVRGAINSGKANGYSCARLNLWASPYKMLNVVGDRNPCSTKVIRLAKSEYMTYGDAESIACDNVSDEYTNQLRIYHMGFVRSKEVHADKIRNMQGDIFQVTPDAKLEGMTTFDPYKWFSEDDLIDIPEPLPKIIQEWGRARE